MKILNILKVTSYCLSVLTTLQFTVNYLDTGSVNGSHDEVIQVQLKCAYLDYFML